MAGTGTIGLKRFHLIYLLGSPENGVRGLLDVPLHGRHLRGRNRVVALLREASSQHEAERIAKLKTLAAKDDKGEAKIRPVELGGGYDLAPDALKEFRKWYGESMNGAMSLAVTPETRDDLRTALDILRNTDVAMDIKTSDVHEAIVEAFEAGLEKHVGKDPALESALVKKPE